MKVVMYRHQSLQEGLVSRASSDSRLVGQLSSATSLVRSDSAELPQLTEPETIHKVVKKIKAMYGSCSSEDSGDVVRMLGSIQVNCFSCIQFSEHPGVQSSCIQLGYVPIRMIACWQAKLVVKAAAAHEQVLRHPYTVYETHMRDPSWLDVISVEMSCAKLLPHDFIA